MKSMKGTERSEVLCKDLARRGIVLTVEQARILRRASHVLHRWAERECGESGPFSSSCLERDDDGIPWHVTYFHSSAKASRIKVPDLENTALSRVGEICQKVGLIFYHQTDPRGVALYVGREEWLGGLKPDACYNSRLIPVI